MNIATLTVREAVLRWSGKVATFMEKRPVLANSILCFNLWVAGDLLAQSYEHENKPLDYRRTFQAASYGGGFTGPLYALWFPFLERQCIAWKVASRFQSSWAVPMVKVAADEIIMDPPAIAMFFTYMEFCQNNMTFDYEQTKSKIVSELPGAWATSLVAWPAVLLATFRFVPLYGQSIVVNMFAIVWDGFLSHRNAVANQRVAAQVASEEEASTVKLRKRSTHRLSVQLTRSVTKGSEEKRALQASKEE